MTAGGLWLGGATFTTEYGTVETVIQLPVRDLLRIHIPA